MTHQNEPFPVTFERVRREADVSIEDVGLELKARYGRSRDRPRGLSLSTLQKVASGAQAPTAALMAAVADVIGIDPMTFAEYRLAMARTSLDEREVGLDEALAQLSRLEGALRERPQARARARRRDEREPGSPQRPQASPRGDSTRSAS